MIRRKFIKYIATLTSLPLLLGLSACEDPEESTPDLAGGGSGVGGGGDSGDDGGGGDDNGGDDGDDGGGVGSSCTTGAVSMYTNPSHAHGALGLTAAEVSAADTTINYELMDGGHPHFFTLTAQDFADIQQGIPVNVVDNEGHGHNLEITCNS